MDSNSSSWRASVFEKKIRPTPDSLRLISNPNTCHFKQDSRRLHPYQLQDPTQGPAGAVALLGRTVAPRAATQLQRSHQSKRSTAWRKLPLRSSTVPTRFCRMSGRCGESRREGLSGGRVGARGSAGRIHSRNCQRGLRQRQALVGLAEIISFHYQTQPPTLTIPIQSMG